MKTLTLLFFTILFFNLPVKALDAYFDYNIFYVPGQGPMVETYLNFFGESVTFEPIEDGEKASVEITMIFFSGDSIVDFSKKIIHSTTKVDSVYDDFLDQQRFVLGYGEYLLEIQLRQPNLPDHIETFTEEVVILPPVGETFFSDVQWISAYKKATEVTEWTKAGYDLLPFVSNFIPREMNQLLFYTEIYGTDGVIGEGEPLLLSFHIENFDNSQVIESTVKRNRLTGAKVIPVMKQLNIEEIPSGNYNLVFELRNQNNEVIASQNRFFQRSGTVDAAKATDYTAALGHNVFVTRITDMDTLFGYIESLRPISGDGEKSLIDQFQHNKNLDLMQRFFYNFWYTRDNQNPELAWDEYLQEVKIVEDKYGMPNKRGYETDMGRIRLTYGPPDVVTDRPAEPSAYPYQIWQYFRAGQWTNVRCVFYDRTLLQRDYELLHCDKIRGEIKNPRWDMLIHQRDTPLNNVDRTNSRDHFGGRSQDMWETPR